VGHVLGIVKHAVYSGAGCDLENPSNLAPLIDYCLAEKGTRRSRKLMDIFQEQIRFPGDCLGSELKEEPFLFVFFCEMSGDL
jgi:hypothetical protein